MPPAKVLDLRTIHGFIYTLPPYERGFEKPWASALGLGCRAHRENKAGYQPKPVAGKPVGRRLGWNGKGNRLIKAP